MPLVVDTSDTPSGRRYLRRKTRRRKKRMVKYRRNRLIPLGVPEKMTVRLKYTKTISLDPNAGGAVASHYFWANGMAAVDYTGSTGQPQYFDQLMTFYDHYTVIGSKIRVTPVNPTTADIVPVAYGVILDDNKTFPYGTVDQVIESRQGRNYKLAGPSNIPQTNYSKCITKKFSAKKFFSKKDLVGTSLYTGSSSTSPTEEAMFGVWAGSIGGTDGGNCYFICELEFIAVLSEPKFVAAS